MATITIEIPNTPGFIKTIERSRGKSIQDIVCDFLCEAHITQRVNDITADARTVAEKELK